MGLFTRNKEAVEGARGDDVPFETLKRSPRNVRKPRAPVDGNRDAPPPLDPAETAKTRARRRLIGAVALAAAAVVFVPMLFDRTPVATSSDIALSIPDRDTPFEGRKGVPDPSRGPLKSSGDLPAVAPTSAQPAAEPPQAADAAARADDSREPEAKAPEPKPEVVRPEPKAETKAESRAETKAETRVETKASTRTEPHTAAAVEKPKAPAAEERAKPAPPADDPKALAALEGRPEAGGAAAAASSAGERSFAVQVAAYSSSDKAKAMRDSLVANGLRSYTESVSTAQGLRTRVRLGPFPSRDAADHAKQKLKTMKLDGSVVPL